MLNPWNVDALEEISKELGYNIYTVLQLRLHPAVFNLKEKISADNSGKVYDVDLTYITSRGRWYHHSWKGEESKSGGIATNIGIHFFDLLAWVFGEVRQSVIHVKNNSSIGGLLELKRARVRWFLSIDANTLPDAAKVNGKRTFRSIDIAGEELDLSEGFTDLHTQSYQGILSGQGYTVREARGGVELAYAMRHAKALGLVGDYHPFCTKIV